MTIPAMLPDRLLTPEIVIDLYFTYVVTKTVKENPERRSPISLLYPFFSAP